MRLSEGQTAKVLYPGPLAKGIYLSEDIGAHRRADAINGAVEQARCKVSCSRKPSVVD
jgi:hypothetical protein